MYNFLFDGNYSKNSGNFRYNASSATPKLAVRNPHIKESVIGSPSPNERKAINIINRDLPIVLYKNPKLRLNILSNNSNDLICTVSNRKSNPEKNSIYTATKISPVALIFLIELKPTKLVVAIRRQRPIVTTFRLQ
mmetsp:Transcript_122/g.142  ORF Transcript_122/g.142 Transcript_122/m.142 type:complete len:136 (+) Transcript_122:1710-2117(+)